MAACVSYKFCNVFGYTCTKVLDNRLLVSIHFPFTTYSQTTLKLQTCCFLTKNHTVHLASDFYIQCMYLSTSDHIPNLSPKAEVSL